MNKLSKTELRAIRAERRMKYELRVGKFTTMIRRKIQLENDDFN